MSNTAAPAEGPESTPSARPLPRWIPLESLTPTAALALTAILQGRSVPRATFLDRGAAAARWPAARIAGGVLIAIGLGLALNPFGATRREDLGAEGIVAGLLLALGVWIVLAAKHARWSAGELGWRAGIYAVAGTVLDARGTVLRCDPLIAINLPTAHPRRVEVVTGRGTVKVATESPARAAALRTQLLADAAAEPSELLRALVTQRRTHHRTKPRDLAPWHLRHAWVIAGLLGIALSQFPQRLRNGIDAARELGEQQRPRAR